MTTRFNPQAVDVGTLTGATTTNIVLYDLSTLSIDDADVYVEYMLLGIETSTKKGCRFLRGASFQRLSGTVTLMDAAVLNLSIDFVDATLVGTAPVLTFSGNNIVGQATNIVGTTVRWTGRLWLYSTDL
jgi:hypothetical protein